MTDFEVGTKVLKSFYSKSGLKISYQQMLDRIQPNIIKQRIGIDGIGFGVNSANSEYTFLTDSKINTSMANLAKKANGKLPSGFQDFFKFLSNEAVQINYISAIAVTGLETLKTVGAGAQAIGNSVITAGKIVNFLFPVIVLIFLYFFFDKKTGGELSKAIKGFKK
jgi:hypothetical protein